MKLTDEQLDALEEEITLCRNLGNDPDLIIPGAELEALVSEVRKARAVVDEARHASGLAQRFGIFLGPLRGAIEDYDQ